LRRRFVATSVAVVALCGLWAASASAVETKTLIRPQPDWYTDEFHQQVVEAGVDGVQVSPERFNAECPGIAGRGVSAAGCIVEPYGCTANFVFKDATDWYVGTASHCSDRNGDVVVMQVDTTTLAAVGEVVRQTSAEEPGDDFALIRLYSDVVAKWGVNPAIPVIGGPQGVYTDCSPQMLENYGHGYGVLVAQGKPQGGFAPTWHTDGYGWFGNGAPGDSGSPTVLASNNQGAGNFTHIIIWDPSFEYAPGQLTGMRLSAILEFVGSSIQLVNADGTTTSSGPATCDSGPVASRARKGKRPGKGGGL
jgi:hypothetical protein